MIGLGRLFWIGGGYIAIFLGAAILLAYWGRKS